MQVAKKEVAGDISEIGILLKNCHNDDDVLRNASNIEKHVHKIKGLAPMMGQEQIGYLAVLVDKLLKVVMTGKSVPGIYETLTRSHFFMQNTIDGTNMDFASIKGMVEKNHEDILNK
jgi:HPt (histidine-containing phosphotransfer) domain-containing protein